MSRTGRRRLSVAALAATTLSIGVASAAGAAGTSGTAGLGAEPSGDTGAVAVQVQAPSAAGHAALSARPAGLPVPGLALPSALDAQPAYIEQDSCDPYAKPGTKALAELLRTSFGQGGYGIERLCHLGAISEHKEGRAVDWMLSVNVPEQKAAADAATTWIAADGGAIARRLGIQYVIWNKHMWRAYAPERGWTVYTGSSPHTDHVHISLTWDGAEKRTSWWTGDPVTRLDRGPCRVFAGQYAPIYTGRQLAACPKSLPAAPASAYPVYVVGQSAPTIAIAQKALGLSADGAFGAGTRSAVLTYQARAKLPRTGALDKATWAKLVPASVTPAPTPAPTPTPTPAPVTPPVATPTVIKKLPSVPLTRITPYKAVVLSQGSKGAAVKVLQRSLGLKADGHFGAKTKVAVMALQKAYHLPSTGRTDLTTWNRVELRLFPWVLQIHTTLRRGSTGVPVSMLQKALKLTPDGTFGAGTVTAVVRIQALYGLTRDGVVGPVTWRAVVAEASR